MKKKDAEYKRTSSGGQDLKLQTETNAEYLRDIPDDEKLIFTDFDVSTTKISMDNRPALTRMLKLIESGMIARVIVYERDRLARNVYEYIYIVKKFYEHEVDVIFTASDAPPFSKDLFLETWYGLSAQFEGKRISSRLSDARKRNPASLIGYIKQKVNKENGTSQRIYKADPKSSKEIAQLFVDFSKVESREEIFEVIMKYRGLLDRNEFRVIDILRTPFFAAHFEGTDGLFHKLPNVEPIISLDLFKRVQEKLTEFEQGLQQGISLSQKAAHMTPICSKCHSELKFKKGNIGESGTYSCSKHRKNIISAAELNEKIIESVKEVLRQISISSIEKITLKAVNNQIKILNKQSEELFVELESLCVKFASLFRPTDEWKQIKKLQERIEQTREKLSSTQTQVSSLQLVKDEIRLIIERVEQGLKQLHEKDYLELAELLISSIKIQDNYVLFHYYFSDFFCKMEDMAHVTNK
ncbi:MAG TPA: recombinase family protein [Bacillales bacterium]|nr:recombinase family protein [Bacillales bacterium]